MTKTKTKDNKESAVPLQQQTPAAAPEPMQWFTAVYSTHLGGGAKEKWAALGYDLQWNAGEKRLAPPALARKASLGGAVLRAGDVGDVERKLFIPRPYTPPTPNERQAEFREKYAKQPKVRVLCLSRWANGHFADRVIAADVLPVEWQVGEIRDVPQILFEELKADGNFTNDPELVAAQEQYQTRFQHIRTEYLKAHPHVAG